MSAERMILKYLMAKQQAIEALHERMMDRYGVEPSIEEMAQFCGVSEVAMRNILSASETLQLDTVRRLPILSWLEEDSTPSTKLLSRQARIIALRIGLVHFSDRDDGHVPSLAELGEFYGITRQRAQQIWLEGLDELSGTLFQEEHQDV